ncbi:MAG TPA: hypothetical protein VD969_28235 [Symbiobacteriaceae bacterium]|nr:hypothetical protein [Symbiobacteriaceae bacterium]
MITNGMAAGGAAAGVAGAAGQQQMMVCPQRRSTGFFPGGDGTIPNARPGLIPGTFIGPTLIFAGVLNPGIPTTLPPTNPVVNTTGTQIQIAPAANQTFVTGTGTTTTGAGGTIVG